MNPSAIACRVLAQPHLSRRSYFAAKRGSMASFSFDYANESDVGGFNVSDSEDIFIEDLSEFSNEDIAAPIEGDFDSPLQQLSDSNSDISIVTSHMSLSISDVFHHSELDLKTAAFLGHQIKESIFCFSDKDEARFEWLDSLGNDNLIHSIASNLDMGSSSSTMPLGVTFDGMLKHTEYENAILTEQEMEMMQNFMKATCAMTPECQQADHGTCSMSGSHVAGLQTCNATDFAAPATTVSRLPRSKRTRRVSGWSSGSILSEHQPESQSPTHSLQSSAAQDMAKYATDHNGCTIGIICKQKEGCPTDSYETNIKIKSDASMIENPNGDICKNLGSDENCVNEEGTTRVENSYGGGSVHPRRCRHCLSQKTPQWRAGPMGPKTLCNACGVQYKFGRLFEEYRPAKSPTFVSYKHSNSHKKVMEMRRKALCHKHQTLHHRVQASMVMKTEAGHQPMIDKFTIKPHSPPLWAQIELPCGAHMSDATLIRTRTASEAPSNFLC